MTTNAEAFQYPLDRDWREDNALVKKATTDYLNILSAAARGGDDLAADLIDRIGDAISYLTADLNYEIEQSGSVNDAMRDLAAQLIAAAAAAAPFTPLVDLWKIGHLAELLNRQHEPVGS